MDGEPLNFLFVLLTAMLISMAIIPIMIRFAPKLGMVDLPDPRKVHTNPIPRVGGIGIVIGALVSVLLWAPIDNMIGAYVFGSLVLLLFGAWDDSHELGHYVKFIGQFIAVIAVVYWGDVWVSSMPFIDAPIPALIGKPFTVIAIVGMVNAVNHSDGLDGLAGGESLLSLGGLAYLAYFADGIAAVMISVAVIGGVFGFLRFNTHPAKVFMGDSGSQFLGFSLGVLAVVLTQQVNPGLSMALPLLLLGLPIIDIIAVFAQRIYHGMNWFRATRNHIHHRLLDLGFDHYQSVVIIYSIQAFFVASAFLVRYESDLLVTSLYLGVCMLVFVLLLVGERRNWRANRPGAESGLTRMVNSLISHNTISRWPFFFVKASIPIYLLFGSLWIGRVPRDFGWAAAGMVLVLLFGLVFKKMQSSSYVVRIAIYGMAAFIVYLIQQDALVSALDSSQFRTAYFVTLAIAIALSVRYARDFQFNTTPMDYLLVFVVLVASILFTGQLQQEAIGSIAVKSIILFYGCELVINRGNRLWTGILYSSVIAAAGVVGFKGVIAS